MITVYRVTNVVSGKSYVGLTRFEIAFRWKQHVRAAFRNKRTGALQGAIRKYGADAFVFEALYVAIDVAEAARVERLLIAEHRTVWPLGYNMSTGGEMHTGFNHSVATKEKMRAAALGREISEHQRQIAAENAKRQWQDPEYRERIRQYNATDEAKAFRKIINEKAAALRRGKPGLFFGRTHTPEARAKMSAAQKGKPAWNSGVPMSAEQKRKCSIAAKGRKNSAEHCEKIRAAMNTPEMRAAMAAKTAARWRTKEFREKVMAARVASPQKPRVMSDVERAAVGKRVKDMMRDPRRRASARENGRAQWADPEKRAKWTAEARARGAAVRESNILKREQETFGPSTAAVRAMVRALPAEYVPRDRVLHV